MASVRKITFLDLLSWMQCPMAALGGYRPTHPRGNTDTGLALMRQWPDTNEALSRIVTSLRDGISWMQRTRFGIQRILQDPIMPGMPQDERNYWISNETNHTGFVTLDSILGTPLVVEFDIPYLHVVNTLPEIVLVDTNPLPPDPYRFNSILVEASFLSDMMYLMTGQSAGVRLLAPAYRHETILDVPRQNLRPLIAALPYLEPLAFIRPSPSYCDVRTANGKQWACPVRASGRCSPMGNRKGRQ